MYGDLVKSPRAIVFLGPTLPRDEARQWLGADFRPPARQGDVFRAIDDAPDAILVIDGIFEAVPSVWHHELVAADAAGIAVFGACSMGALRAAELPGVVKPLGEIARRFVRGTWNDDAAVALVHGDEAQGFRPLSVPWVNVWATAQALKRRLGAREAQRLCDVADAMFYQSRTWPRLFDAMGWSADVRALVKAGVVDLKADDARLALRTLAARPTKRRQPRAVTLSSFVRRARLVGQGVTDVPSNDGVKTLLLAELARLDGVKATRGAVERARGLLSGRFGADQLASWADAIAVTEVVLSRAAPGLSAAQRMTWCLGTWAARAGIEPDDEAVQRHAHTAPTGDPEWPRLAALAELVLRAPDRFVSDGPSSLEGTALLRARGASL